ncbi:MAG: hypothetical protein HY556_08905 [Euryarchaeota archaeon]|nr:hypothetical protein [Euryarchaeota archaeon]
MKRATGRHQAGVLGRRADALLLVLFLLASSLPFPASAADDACAGGVDAGPDASTAALISTPTTCGGEMDPIDDADAYKFSATAGERVTVRATGVSNVTLLSPSGAEMDATDALDVHGGMGVEAVAGETGDQVVIIRGSGAYSLDVAVNDPVQTDCLTGGVDAGSFLRSSAPIALAFGSSTCTGRTDTWDARDFYRIDMLPFEWINPKLIVAGGADGSYVMRLWDWNGTLLVTRPLIFGITGDIGFRAQRAARVVVEVDHVSGTFFDYQMRHEWFPDAFNAHRWCPGEGFDGDGTGVTLADTTCFGFIRGNETSDSYTIGVDAGDKIVARASSGATSVRLFDPTATERMDAFYVAEQGFSGFEFTADSGGDWTAVIEGSRDYEVDVYAFDPATQDDCGTGVDGPNLRSNATLITVANGATLSCDITMTARDDVDAFKLDLDRGDRLDFTLTWDPSDITDVDIDFYSPNGSLVEHFEAPGQDGGKVAFAAAPSAGIHTLAIIGVGEHSPNGEAGRFDLAIARSPFDEFDCYTGRDVGEFSGVHTGDDEPLNVSYPFVCPGVIHEVGSSNPADADDYQFHSPGGPIFALSQREYGLNTSLVLRNATRVIKAQVTNNDKGTFYLESPSLPAGDYSIHISGEVGKYELNVTGIRPIGPFPYWDCNGSGDVGSIARALPFTGLGNASVSCVGWLHPDGDTLDTYSWSVWRDWPLNFTIALHDPGTVRVVRTVDFTEVQRKEGSGTVVLTNKLVPFFDYDDDGATEIDRIELVSAPGPLRYTLTVTRGPAPTGGDCGTSTDSSTTSRATLTSGVTCTSHFVDGWTRGLGDGKDGYQIAADDADIVRLEASIQGHSYSMSTNPGPDFGLRPSGPSVLDTTFQMTGAGPLKIDVTPSQPDVKAYETFCWDGSCYTYPSEWWDTQSTAPFDYWVKASVTANARPVLALSNLTTFVQDGDPISFDVTVTDADNDTVRPYVLFGDDGDYNFPYGYQLMPTPQQGPSGTTFHFQTTPSGHSYWGSWSLRINAFDSHDVPALSSPGNTWVSSYRGDCYDGLGDAPADGQAFTGTCNAWLGTQGDLADKLLFETAPGTRVTASVSSGVGFNITSPEDVTRSPLAGVFRDYSQSGGMYIINVDPAGGYSRDYTITMGSIVAVKPTGAVSLVGPSSATRGQSVSYVVRTDDLDTEDVDVTIDWGDGTAPTAFRAGWATNYTRNHTYSGTGTYSITANGTSRLGRTLTGSLRTVDVVALPDCQGPGDAPAEGRSFTTSCKGYVGHEDTEDLLLYAAPSGTHLRFNLTNATFEVTAPDGSHPAVISNVAHDYASSAGTWTIRVAPTNASGDFIYNVSVNATNAPAPTGVITGSFPAFWPVPAAMPVTFTAVDLDYEDVNLSVDWGDGVVQRVPAAGYSPSGSPLSPTHAYTAAGNYSIKATGVTRDGAALGELTRNVTVFRTDDCGAGEAPNSNPWQAGRHLSGQRPALEEGPACWGSVNASDTLDYYFINSVAYGDWFSVSVCPTPGLSLDPLLYQVHAGVGAATITGESFSAGCWVLAPATLLIASSDSYMLRVMRSSGAGAYNVTLDIRENYFEQNGLVRPPPVGTILAEPPSNETGNGTGGNGTQGNGTQGNSTGGNGTGNGSGPATTESYSFGDSSEGFVRENNGLWSDVGWEILGGRIGLKSDRQDPSDERFVHPLNGTWNQSSGSFNVSARWATSSQGNWQGAVPLFIGESGLADAVNGRNSLAVHYQSRDWNLGQKPEYYLKYRDSSGTLRLNAKFVGEADTEYRFAFDYDNVTRLLTMRILSAAGEELLSASYTTGAQPGDGFQLGKLGVTSDGWSGTMESAVQAWVDDIVVSYRPAS